MNKYEVVQFSNGSYGVRHSWNFSGVQLDTYYMRKNGKTSWTYSVTTDNVLDLEEATFIKKEMSGEFRRHLDVMKVVS